MTEMRKKILIADDEEGVRESLRLVLADDYDLVFAENGEATWDAIRYNDYDLVFMDVKMPKLDGLEVLRRIRTAGNHVPVLILTAYQSIELAKEAVKLGALEYVPKPFDRAQVKKLVDETLTAVNRE